MTPKRIILETIFQMTLKSQFWKMFHCVQHLQANILRFSNNFRPRLIRNGEMWWVDRFLLHLEVNIPHNDSSWLEFVVQVCWRIYCRLQVGMEIWYYLSIMTSKYLVRNEENALSFISMFILITADSGWEGRK